MNKAELRRKFRVRQVLKQDAWYFELTNDLRVMVVTNQTMQYDPIVKLKNISEKSLSVVTDQNVELELEFKNLQLLNLPNIRAIRVISGMYQPAESEPILLALYDLSGIIYREIHQFGTEVLEPGKIVNDYDEICEVHDRDVLLQAVEYILNSQKQ